MLTELGDLIARARAYYPRQQFILHCSSGCWWAGLVSESGTLNLGEVDAKFNGYGETPEQAVTALLEDLDRGPIEDPV